MNGRSFLDSNVLVYTDDPRHPEKQRSAIELLSRCRRSNTGVVSAQVLQEYFVVVTRKLGVEQALARRKVELFGQFSTVKTGVDDILAAIDLCRLHGVHFWDALVIRSAQQAGCRRLFSEDLQCGRRFDSVEIVNPFAPEPLAE